MSENKSLFKKMFQDPDFFVAFGFGSGLIPFAPGTCGTIIAIPIYICLSFLPWYLYLLFVFLAFIYGVKICDRVSNALKVHDFKGIVWDECVGYWISRFLAPTGWQWIVLGFLLFRLFDILKPGPIAKIDRLVKGGLGVMLDDVLAGVFALACIQLIAFGVLR
jgi:phosphatidylglycerophosphatase A